MKSLKTNKGRRRRAVLGGGMVVLGGTAALLTTGAAPAAANLESVTVTLLGGAQITVTVDVPPGTPLNAINTGIPGVVSVAASPAAAGTSAGIALSATTPSVPGLPSIVPSTSSSSSATTAATTSTTTSTTLATPSGAPKVDRTHRLVTSTSGTAQGTTVTTHQAPPAIKTAPNPFTLANGTPLGSDPTLSLALPTGDTQLENFFIDNFQIPPYLLPIYQAAGSQYDVPWQVLAAINQIETDYGRDLSTSTAGAIGWMQFEPQEWKQYGLNETGTGADPYNPTDAIFAAARYLHAADAGSNLRGAIFSYNHSNSYVDSVLLRAQLIGGMPPALVSAVTGLTQGQFPVAAPATYADNQVDQSIADQNAAATGEAAPSNPLGNRIGTEIFAAAGAPVVAVQDSQIVKIGHSHALGNYVELRDAYGNLYTYSGLKTLAAEYPVPKPVTESAAQIAQSITHPVAAPETAQQTATPTAPASAGHQPDVLTNVTGAVSQAASAVSSTVQSLLSPRPRLFAHPDLPAAVEAGALTALLNASTGLPGGQSFASYFTDSFGLPRSAVVLEPLRTGDQVIAGTILGRIGQTTGGQAAHVLFQIKPAGAGAPYIDPKPLLDDWMLLSDTSLLRAKGINPFLGKPASAGQVLLESKEQLQEQVLSDPHVDIYACGRRDIEAGLVDQRVLGALEYLVANGLDPTVSSLRCGASSSAVTNQALLARSNTDATNPVDLTDAAEHSAGDAVTITALNGIPLVGHQGAGSITEIAIHQLLALQGTFQPHELISGTTVPSSLVAFSLPTYADELDVAYLPLDGSYPHLAAAVSSALKPAQWVQLISRLGQIPGPDLSALGK